MKKIFTILSMFILLLSGCVYGYSMQINGNINSNKLETNKEYEIKLNISKLDAGNGIDTITLKLEYDKEVFDKVSKNDISADNSWMVSYNDEKDAIIMQNDKINKTGDLLTLKLKTKSNLKNDSTTILLKNIIASGGIEVNGGTGDIRVEDLSFTLDGKSESSIYASGTNEITKENKNVSPNFIESNSNENSIEKNKQEQITTNKDNSNTSNIDNNRKTLIIVLITIMGIIIISIIALLIIEIRNRRKK